jgi:hypothetical protein
MDGGGQMVLVRPTAVLATMTGAFPRRSELPLYGMQLVGKGNVWWAEKTAWFRNVPVTAVYPTPGQIETRIRFGELAKRAKAEGKTGTRASPALSTRLGRYFVGSAAYIADNMAGFTASRRLAPEQYPSRLRRTLRTLEELKAMAGV